MPSVSTDDPETLLEHATWLRRLALHLAHDASAADELVQDTWVAALRRPPSADRPVRPWLRRVIGNVARFRWRGEQHRAAREQAYHALADDAAPSSAELLERHETQRLLARLVAELEEPFRAAILLRYGEGLEPAEIARRLGVPAGTVRSRLAEGLERLRVRLDALHRGDRRAWIAALAPFAPFAVPAPAPRAPRPVARVLALGAAAIAVAILVVLAVARRPASPGQAPRRDPAAARTSGGDAPAAAAAWSAPPGWVAQPGVLPRRVAGRVMFDGAPVGGARVRLTSDLSRTGLAAALDQRTRADGRFDFGVQPAREVELGAAAPGRLAAVAHVDLRDPTGRPPADALELTLGGCLAAFHGTVSDASGTPIAGAELLREDVIGAQTDAAGRYELCMLPVAAAAEQLELVVRARGYGSLAIDAGLAGRERLDIVLTPEAVIDGRARMPDGAPVAAARIWIEPYDPGRRDTEHGARLIAATDRDGRFHVEGVAGGRHRIGGGGAGVTAAPIIVAIAPGAVREVELVMAPAARIHGRVVRGGAPVAGARVTVADGDAEVARSQVDGSFVLDRVPIGKVQLVASPYRVRAPEAVVVVAGDNDVTLEVEALGGLRGTVRRHGEPVPGARVCAGRKPEGGAPPERNTCGNADPGGRYELAGLAPGTYGLFADDAAAGAGVHGVRVALAAAEQRELDLELTDGARIAGVVVDATGAPVPGVHLRFAAARAADEARCVSGGDGRFACPALQGGGSYEVTAYAGPDRTVALRFVEPPPAIQLAGGDSSVDDLRLVVDPARLAIRGTIVDAAGAPVVDARVRAWGNGREPTWLAPSPGGASDGDGAFRIAGLAPGSYALEVRTADGFRVLEPPVTAGSEVRLVVDAALCKDPRLAAESDPIRRSIVRAEPDDIRARPPRPVIWDRRIQLVGWSLPDRIRSGQPFEVALYYKVLAPIDQVWDPAWDQAWKVFVHFDGASGRAGRADHEPLGGRCPMSSWQPGDYIVDRFTSQLDVGESRRAAPGSYRVWTGFFTGWAPRWTNLAVSEAPPELRDATDRVKIATVILE